MKLENQRKFDEIYEYCQLIFDKKLKLLTKLNLYCQTQAGRKSKLGPFKPYILEKFKEGPYTAARLYREIKEMGFDEGKIIFKGFVQKVQPDQGPLFVLRYKTKSSLQDQVDWAEIETVEVDGKIKKLFCFNMILRYSNEIC